MKSLIIGMVFCLCLGLLNAYAKEELSEIQGKVVMVELEPSADPKNPNLWPCLLIQRKPNVLVGEPDILEELSYLYGKRVVLKAKPLPKQKFNKKEYSCFEVSQIEKMDGRDYLSSRQAIGEFKEVLHKRGIIDEAGKQKIEGALKSVWFDKNENGIIDAGDRLFVVSRSTGKSERQYVLYPSQVVVRGKDKEVYYDTFILKDPFPRSFEPAVMGSLKYDVEKNTYSVDVDRIYSKEDNVFGSLQEEEKTIIIGENEMLKPFIGKKILLVGDRYETILWQGDTLQEISRQDSQYLITVKGKISITQVPSQQPWKLSLVLLQDKEGQLYELRQVGYAGFWKELVGKEVVITGLLRPLSYLYEYKPTCVIQVTKIE